MRSGSLIAIAPASRATFTRADAKHELTRQVSGCSSPVLKLMDSPDLWGQATQGSRGPYRRHSPTSCRGAPLRCGRCVPLEARLCVALVVVRESVLSL